MVVNEITGEYRYKHYNTPRLVKKLARSKRNVCLINKKIKGTRLANSYTILIDEVTADSFTGYDKSLPCIIHINNDNGDESISNLVPSVDNANVEDVIARLGAASTRENEQFAIGHCKGRIGQVLAPYYLVSNYGPVFSLVNMNFINKHPQEDLLPDSAYRHVHLRSTKQTNMNIAKHRLLFTVFKRPVADGMTIDHIDRNLPNNYIDNLKEVTSKENSENKTFATATNTSKYEQMKYSIYDTTAKEEWKPIPDESGLISTSSDYYLAADLGGILHCKETAQGIKATRPLFYVNQDNYLRVQLQQQAYRLVHDYIDWAWLGPPPTSGHEVDHINGRRRNNHEDNLEWVTPKENMERVLGISVFCQESQDK